MASSKQQQQQQAAGGWTQRQNKQFECALAVYDKETPERWQNVSRYMGGAKSPDEVRRHFDHLLHDVARIESSAGTRLIPFLRYNHLDLDATTRPIYRYLKFQ
uniref:Myb-like domain-containing protein n=1 Tax=Leersia perrieri TaxID=77586 RepID=A0A0D9WK58_9ORYZ